MLHHVEALTFEQYAVPPLWEALLVNFPGAVLRDRQKLSLYCRCVGAVLVTGIQTQHVTHAHAPALCDVDVVICSLISRIALYCPAFVTPFKQASPGDCRILSALRSHVFRLARAAMIVAVSTCVECKSVASTLWLTVTCVQYLLQ
jgi:hypothetical protein